MALTSALRPPASAPEAVSTLRRHVNLTLELAWTQFKLKYTGSVLGYFWSLLKPLMLFSILFAIFVVLFKQRTNEFALQLLVGVVVFTFFTDATGVAMSSIAGAGHLIRKAYFPRAILVVASTITALLTMMINLTLIVVVATPLGHLHFGLYSAVLPLLLVELYALALGFAFLLSSLFVFYRDLGHIWEIVTQVLFYASAIVYPVVAVPERFRGLFFINPLAQVVEDVRHAIVISVVPWTADYVGVRILVPLGITAIVLVAGLLVFRRLTPVFAEYL
ncbi:MAG TPA: ABC transporter permease [Candidatus Dormibacteraeota bacterium]|nr:ABC transporter permease [Candidatus Dormibacteraeota bacterium]